jgi:hypothetical protein
MPIPSTVAAWQHATRARNASTGGARDYWRAELCRRREAMLNDPAGQSYLDSLDRAPALAAA